MVIKNAITENSCPAPDARRALQLSPAHKSAAQRVEDGLPHDPREQRAIDEAHGQDEQGAVQRFALHPAGEHGEKKIESEHGGEPIPQARRMA